MSVEVVLWKYDDKMEELTLEEIWDDTALIEAYDNAVNSIMQDGFEDESIPPSSTGKRKLKKKKKTSEELNEHYDEDHEYQSNSNIDTSPRYKKSTSKQQSTKPKEETTFLKPSASATTASMSAASAAAIGAKPYKGSKWQVSSLCYAPDAKGIYTMAVINSFIDNVSCLVTFLEREQQQQVRIEYLKKKLKYPLSSAPSSDAGSVRSHPSFADRPSNNNVPSNNPTNRGQHLNYPPTDGQQRQQGNFSGMPWQNQPWAPSPHPHQQTQRQSAFPNWGNVGGANSNRFMPPPTPMLPHQCQCGGESQPPSSSSKFIPPPPSVVGCHGNADDDSLADMLMAWYMSGYHTGYYQGKQAR